MLLGMATSTCPIREEVAYCETLRERASRLLHCDSTQVAIVASASEILGQLPMLLQPRLKSTILAVSSDFPAITRPWFVGCSKSTYMCALLMISLRPIYRYTHRGN